MTWQEGILLFTATVNAVAACLAWAAKLRWSKEYRQASDRIIEAKDEALAAKEAEISVFRAHIEQLERLNPKTIVEWARAVQEMAKEFVERLKHQLEEAQKVITELETSGKKKEGDLRRVKGEKQRLEEYVFELERNVAQGERPAYTTLVNSANLSLQLSGMLAETVSESSSGVMLNIRTKKETD